MNRDEIIKRIAECETGIACENGAARTSWIALKVYYTEWLAEMPA